MKIRMNEDRDEEIAKRVFMEKEKRIIILPLPKNNYCYD